MKITFVVETKEYENHKKIINSIGGEIISTKLEQLGFCENANLICECKVPKKNFKKLIKNS